MFCWSPDEPVQTPLTKTQRSPGCCWDRRRVLSSMVASTTRGPWVGQARSPIRRTHAIARAKNRIPGRETRAGRNKIDRTSSRTERTTWMTLSRMDWKRKPFFRLSVVPMGKNIKGRYGKTVIKIHRSLNISHSGPERMYLPAYLVIGPICGGINRTLAMANGNNVRGYRNV